MLKLKLVKVGKHKVQVVKLIRMFTQLGLKESKTLMDKAPSILISHRKDIDLEQIIKNFAAIGAVVEKIKEAPEKKEVPIDTTAGKDESYSIKQPGTAKQGNKEYKKKKSFVKSDNQKTTIVNKNEQKLKLKPTITFIAIVALIKSISNIYFGLIGFFYSIFIVAIGIAYFLKKHNFETRKKIGTVAFGFTILYFFAIRIVDAIVLFVLYQYVVPLNLISLFVSLFTSRNFLVLLAAIMAYFLAKKNGIFELILPGTQTNSSNFMENKNLKNHKEKKKF